MHADHRSYLDTSALAKWYLPEPNSELFVEYLQHVGTAVISSLTCVEMRSLLARLRRMQKITDEIELTIFQTFQDDIDSGFLHVDLIDDQRFSEATHLIAHHEGQPLRTLDALHLCVARFSGINEIATADHVMANTARAMGLQVAEF